MERIKWGPELSVLIESMDLQHQRLVQITNDVIQAVDTGDFNAAQNLASLIEYVRTHFIDEEKLMLEYEFPGYEDHCKHHAHLTSSVMKFREMLNNGETISAPVLADFLIKWLKTHILEQDKQYGFYIQSQLEQDQTIQMQ